MPVRIATSICAAGQPETPPSRISAKAAEILADWASWKARFKVLVPPSEKANLGLEQRETVAA